MSHVTRDHVILLRHICQGVTAHNIHTLHTSYSSYPNYDEVSLYKHPNTRNSIPASSSNHLCQPSANMIHLHNALSSPRDFRKSFFEENTRHGLQRAKKESSEWNLRYATHRRFSQIYRDDTFIRHEGEHNSSVLE